MSSMTKAESDVIVTMVVVIMMMCCKAAVCAQRSQKGQLLALL